MKIADTSFLIGFFVSGDLHNSNARTIFQSNEEELTILFEVLFETLTVLNGLKGMAFANRIYKEMQENLRFTFRPPLNAQEHEKCFSYFINQTPDQHLSYIDCLQIVLAKEEQKQIVTFDKKIKAAMKPKLIP